MFYFLKHLPFSTLVSLSVGDLFSQFSEKLEEIKKQLPHALTTISTHLPESVSTWPSFCYRDGMSLCIKQGNLSCRSSFPTCIICKQFSSQYHSFLLSTRSVPAEKILLFHPSKTRNKNNNPRVLWTPVPLFIFILHQKFFKSHLYLSAVPLCFKLQTSIFSIIPPKQLSWRPPMTSRLLNAMANSQPSY